jgi:YVTN family beta-propeller protein
MLSGATLLSARGQYASIPKHTAPMVLTGAIPLPNVRGRIDHFAFDPAGNQLFVSALGNNTVEVVNVSTQTVVHAIAGVLAPQGLAYSLETNKLFVASDEGKLYIFDGISFELITSIDFGDDVDNLRYDTAESRIYVGFGDGKNGAIGMVDAKTNQRLPKEYKLTGHPESFQLLDSYSRIYVNVPDLHEVACVERLNGDTQDWPLSLKGNFPMALDEGHARLFVATREPAKLVVLDTKSGKVVATLPVVQDSDDLYYDEERKRVYASGGEGFISVFQQDSADRYRLLANIPSAVGARTSGYFGKGRKGFDRFYVAVPARADHGAELLIYTVQD